MKYTLMTNPARIQRCIDKHEEYVLTLAAMPDSKLRDKLETIHLQMDLALQQNNTEALKLLEVWRSQTIEARTYKAEHDIPDLPDEMEAVVAQIETFVAEEENRAEILEAYRQPAHKKAPHTNTGNSQLSIF